MFQVSPNSRPGSGTNEALNPADTASRAVKTGVSPVGSGGRTRQSTDEIYNEGAYADMMQQPQGLNPQIKKPKPEADTEETADRLANETIRRASVTSRLRNRVLRKNSRFNPVAKVTNKLTRQVDRRVIEWMIWASLTLWAVQIMFAILGIIGLGLGAASKTLTYEDGGVLGAIAGFGLDIVNFFTSLIGIELIVAFEGLFWVSFIVIYSLFIFSTVLITTICAIMGMKPVLGGNGTTLKVGAFLFGLFGCMVPLLNLTPFVTIWLFTIWLNPR